MTPKEVSKWECCGEEKVPVHETKPGSGIFVGGIHFCGGNKMTPKEEAYELAKENKFKTWIELEMAIETALARRDEKIRELESKLKEKEEEIERLKNLTHFGYSQVPELESKLKTAVEALTKIKSRLVAGNLFNIAEEALEQIRGGQK